MIHFFENIFVAACSSEAFDGSFGDNFTFLDPPASDHNILCLTTIQSFAIAMHEVESSATNHTVVVCHGSFDISVRLINSYLLLVKKQSLKHVLENTASFESRVGIELCIEAAFFQALHHAKKHSWIDFKVREGELIADNLEEHIHYASPANGHIHIIVPGKLVIIPDSVAFPDPAQLWQDQPATDSAVPARLFSPRFYAELLRDLGMGVVVWLGPADEGSVVTMAACGLTCEDRLLPRRSRSLLRAHDRLLALRRAGAAVALHCGAGDAGHGRILALTQLVELGLPGPAAEAWLRLACPRLAEGGTEARRVASSPA